MGGDVRLETCTACTACTACTVRYIATHGQALVAVFVLLIRHNHEGHKVKEVIALSFLCKNAELSLCIPGCECVCP